MILSMLKLISDRKNRFELYTVLGIAGSLWTFRNDQVMRREDFLISIASQNLNLLDRAHSSSAEVRFFTESALNHTSFFTPILIRLNIISLFNTQQRVKLCKYIEDQYRIIQSGNPQLVSKEFRDDLIKTSHNTIRYALTKRFDEDPKRAVIEYYIALLMVKAYRESIVAFLYDRDIVNLFKKQQLADKAIQEARESFNLLDLKMIIMIVTDFFHDPSEDNLFQENTNHLKERIEKTRRRILGLSDADISLKKSESHDKLHKTSSTLMFFSHSYVPNSFDEDSLIKHKYCQTIELR